MGIKSNLLVQATKYNNKRVVKFTLGLFDALGKLFSSARKKEHSHSREDHTHKLRKEGVKENRIIRYKFSQICF